MNLIILDIALLVLFLVFASYFLHKNKKNLMKEGSLYLYKTQWGVKLIDKIGTRYQKSLKVLSYVSIGVGYLLMIGMIILILRTVYLYLTTSIATVIKAPPVMPLIPYFPRLFGLESVFPPFYFVYFIVALLIVATVHEFSHGIFARRFGIKIKSTGFAFFKYFPALFGAFVEQDDKDMDKKGKFEQLTVLSAGVFANLLMVILFFFILVGVFWIAFTPSGVVFDTYSYSAVEIASIVSVGGINLEIANYENVFTLTGEDLTEIKTDRENYIATKAFLEQQDGNEFLVLYDDAPAINAKISGAITEINGFKTNSLYELSKELEKYSAGETVKIKSINPNSEITTYEIVLENHPVREGAWLGIGFNQRETGGVMGTIYSTFSFFKEPNVYYAPKNNLSTFVYDLLWWIILINFAVALFNMLPLGILDGGRFFYLTIWGITKSEKFAKWSFATATYFLLFLLLVLMIKWILVWF